MNVCIESNNRQRNRLKFFNAGAPPPQIITLQLIHISATSKERLQNISEVLPVLCCVLGSSLVVLLCYSTQTLQLHPRLYVGPQLLLPELKSFTALFNRYQPQGQRISLEYTSVAFHMRGLEGDAY